MIHLPLLQGYTKAYLLIKTQCNWGDIFVVSPEKFGTMEWAPFLLANSNTSYFLWNVTTLENHTLHNFALYPVSAT